MICSETLDRPPIDYSIARALLVDPSGDILMLQRADLPVRPYEWDLPGGVVDDGENPREAAIRETFEETGLITPSLEEIFRVEQRRGENLASWHFFAGSIAAGSDVKLSSEHLDSRLVPPQQAILTISSPFYREVIGHLIEHAQLDTVAVA